jgi:hypothetical protein
MGRVAAFSDGVVAIAITRPLLRVVDPGSRRVLRTDADGREVSGITRSYIPGVPLYATATLLAFASPIASLAMFGALALFYALSSGLFDKEE